jgi:hypothetical protein
LLIGYERLAGQLEPRSKLEQQRGSATR